MKTYINLLIIDDNEDDRAFYQRLLRKFDDYDFTIFEAESGEEGYEIFTAQNIQCVLLDYSLPKKNGIQTLEKMNKNQPHTPVVMLTGQGNESIASQSIKKGAQDYLAKNSISEEKLKKAIHNAIQRSNMMRKIDKQRENLEIFSHMLAHDLKDPLRMISDVLERIQDDIGNTLEDRNKKYFSYVIDGANRMDKLIATLSTYIEVDEATPEHNETDMNHVANSAIANLKLIITEKNATITLDKLPTISGEESQLIQLIQNLISNGLKYCEDNNPTIHISAKESGSFWIIAVKDNGIGIKKENISEIFEPFKRLHNAETYGGTGLGLATCRKIIERHEGEIWCESEANMGTTFCFKLKS